MTAAAHDASVPAVLAGTLLGVTGLDGMPHYVRTQTLPRGNPRPPAAVIQPTPCSQAYGQITANRAANGSPLPKFDGPHRRYGTCGYLPQQLNGAYGTDTTGYTGRGQTVGIVLWYASATQPADVNRFSRAHDWPQFRPGQYHQVLPGSFNQGRFCGGVQQEQAIDITSIRFTTWHPMPTWCITPPAAASTTTCSTPSPVSCTTISDRQLLGEPPVELQHQYGPRL